MAELKSSYEIALTRTIPSKHGDEIASQKLKLKEKEKKRKQKLPDFIREWEDFIERIEGESEKAKEETEEEEEVSSIMVENNYSRVFTPEEIRESQKNKKKPVEQTISIGSHGSNTNTHERVYNQDAPEVHWYGHFYSYTGFSRMNRAMAFGLSNKGVKVKTDIQGGDMDINEATQSELRMLSNLNVRSDAPKVFGATVPLQMFHGGHKILYTMMETSMTLHPEYVEKLNYFNEIWVPTYQGRDLFVENGVKPPIHVMPLGVDIDRYNLSAKPFQFPFPTKNFIFTSVFKWGMRKGYDALLQAFLEEFSNEDDVTLLLVSRVISPHEKGKIMEEVMDILKQYGDPSKLPHVALYDAEIPERDMPKIYRASSAFVLLSRGEGFGLPYYEAAACGLPVIGSNCSGQTDILSATDGSFNVTPDLMVQAKINGSLSRLAKHCKFYEDQYFPSFGKKAINEAKTYMRNIYENYDAALDKAQILTDYVLNNCGWDVAVNNVYERIIELN